MKWPEFPPKCSNESCRWHHLLGSVPCVWCRNDALRTALAESRAELETEREARKRLASDCGAYSDRLQVIEWRAERLRVALETIVRNEELHPQWQCVGVLNVARTALAESRAREGRYKPVIDEVLRQTDVSTCPLCEVRDYDDDGTERHDDECPVPELQDALASAPASREGETSETVNDDRVLVDVRCENTAKHPSGVGRERCLRARYHDGGCEYRSDAARGRDPSGEEAANELTREAQRLGMYDAPAQATGDEPDSAERAARAVPVPMTDEQIDRKARDIIANITHEPNTKGTCMTVAFESMYEVLVEYERLLRTRDAQAREAGRVEGWNEAVEACARYVEVSQNRHTWNTTAANLRALKEAGRAEERAAIVAFIRAETRRWWPITGSAIAEDFADAIERGDYLKRPDRAKGGGEP